MSIFLLDTTSAPIPKSVPDLSVLPPFRLHAAANRGREKEMLTRSMIAYQRAIKPLSQTLIRETGKLQNQQAEFVGKLEDLKNGLVQAERKLKLQMRSGGNIGEAYREKLEVLAAIKELKERHGHIVERGRQRQQHQRQAMVEYREHLNQCKHQLVRNSEQLASRRNLSISFDNSDDEDEAKLLGRPVPTMERMRREGAESPTEILLQDLKLEEKNVLDSIRDRERLAQILRVEGISNLQPQLSNCGITTAQDLASMSVHQIYSLPFTKPEKNILQSSARTARELRGLPASESSRHGAAAMLTSRAYDASFSHRAPVYEDHDSTIRKKMEEAVRGRSEPELLALVRGPHGHECVRQADQDGWTLLHRACIPNQPKTSKPKSPLRVFTPSSSEMQHRGIALPFSSPRKPSTPSVQSLKSPGKARSPRSSIQVGSFDDMRVRFALLGTDLSHIRSGPVERRHDAKPAAVGGDGGEWKHGATSAGSTGLFPEASAARCSSLLDATRD
eukprot:1124102-Rhodomonas_salina.2